MQAAKSQLLRDAVELLVTHFGVEQVLLAMNEVYPEVGASIKVDQARTRRTTRPNTLQELLTQTRLNDPERYRILVDFRKDLHSREVLPEAEDIRHYVQLIGVKEVSGKSRKDMVRSLIRSLIDVPIDLLKQSIDMSRDINLKTREKGYSDLVDKLLSRE